MSEENDNSFNRALGRLEGKMDSMVAAVKTLAASFESLEKGRLSRLEIAFATLKAETVSESAAGARWTSALWSIGITVVGAILLHYVFKLL